MILLTKLHDELREIMDKLGIKTMPSRGDIEKVTGKSRLSTQVSRQGGFKKVSEDMGIKNYDSAYRQTYTEEEIKNRILQCVKILSIDRMPSRSEILRVENNSGLHSQICRGYGYYGWAEKLGLPIKQTETSMGKGYEKIFLEDCANKGYLAEQMTMKNAYDILVSGNIKVDVKSSRLYHGPHGNFFAFNLEKKNHNCDLFALYCCNDDLTEHDLYLVPSCFVMNKNQISIGEKKSKYHIFKDRWDYVDMYDKFYISLLSTDNTIYEKYKPF